MAFFRNGNRSNGLALAQAALVAASVVALMALGKTGSLDRCLERHSFDTCHAAVHP